VHWLHFEIWEKETFTLSCICPTDKTQIFLRKSYSFTFSSFIGALARAVGVVDADGMGVDAAVFLFRLLVVLLILSDPGLLGGDSLTVGPIMFTEPALLMLLKCPTVGPWIIDGTEATVAAGGGVWWLFLAPLLDVVPTAVLDTEVTIDGIVCDGSDDWLLDEPRFGLRGFSCLSDDWELKVNERIKRLAWRNELHRTWHVSRQNTKCPLFYITTG